MARISEPELVLPALKVIADNPGISTSELIDKLEEELQPTGEDLQILPSRGDNKFSQKVRNLRSHSTLDQDGPGYTRYERKGRNGHWWITPKGRTYLKNNREPIDYLIEDGFKYSDVVDGLEKATKASKVNRKVTVYPEDLQISEGARRRVSTTVYNRSRRLREAAIDHYTHKGSIKCEACGFDFAKKYGKLGQGYIEMHHKKPLFQNEGQATSDFINQARKNLAPLCSNCHRMIHVRRKTPLTVKGLQKIIAAK